MEGSTIADSVESCLDINNMLNLFTALGIKDEVNLALAAAFDNA